MSSKPISVRCNNPLNLRPGSPWEGLSDPPFIKTDSGEFCNFISAPFGFRAPMKVYITKADRGVSTIRRLINEWSPPDGAGNSQASTDAYISAVCKSSGYLPDDSINLKSYPVASAICYAQTTFESGEPFEKNWKMTDMAEGAYRAGIADAPPPITKRVLQKVTGVGATLATGAGAAEPIVSGWAGASHSPNMQMAFLIVAGVLALIAALVKK